MVNKIVPSWVCMPATLAVLLGLAACARTPVVSYNLVVPPPRAHEIREAVGGRDVPVTVTGSPFPDIGPRQLAAIVVADMPSICGARYHPVDAVGTLGIAWSFDRGLAAGSTREIAADLQLTAPVTNRLSEVQGHITGVGGADDPAFASFVHQMTLRLLGACG